MNKKEFKKHTIRGIITGVFKYNNNLILRIGKKNKVCIPYKSDTSDFFSIYDYLGLVFKGEGIPDKYYGGKFKNFIKINQNDFSIQDLNLDKNIRIQNIFKAMGLNSFYEYLTKENKKRKTNYLITFFQNPFIFVEKEKIDFLTALSFFYLKNGKIDLFPLYGTPAALSWYFWECYNEKKQKLIDFYTACSNLEKELLIKFPDPEKIKLYCDKNKKLIFFNQNDQTFYFDWKFFQILNSVYDFLDRYLPEHITSQPLIDPTPEQVLQKIEEQKITILTGKGGTGKSTFLFSLKYILEQKGKKILLTGTTGNAASILQGITVAKAFDTFNHLKKEKPPSYYYDIIAIDEASMLNTVEFYKILKKLRPNQKLLLSGDPDQLPPVKGDNIFTEIVERAKKNNSIILLTKKRRFSPTKKNILYIFQDPLSLLWGFSYAYFFYLNKIIKEQIHANQNTDHNKSIDFENPYFLSTLPMIITPYHRTNTGTKKLNYLAKTIYNFVIKNLNTLTTNKTTNKKNNHFPSEIIQTIINKNPDLLPPFYFEINDIVILTQNIYNGNKILAANKEKAIIKEIYEDEKEVFLFLPKKETYLRTKITHIAPAYAVEFFTAQGSETDYSFVFLPDNFVKSLITDHEKTLKALNMASTRAKKINFFLTTKNCNLQLLKQFISFDIEKIVTSETINKLIHKSKQKTNNKTINKIKISYNKTTYKYKK